MVGGLSHLVSFNGHKSTLFIDHLITELFVSSWICESLKYTFILKLSFCNLFSSFWDIVLFTFHIVLDSGEFHIGRILDPLCALVHWDKHIAFYCCTRGWNRVMFTEIWAIILGPCHNALNQLWCFWPLAISMIFLTGMSPCKPLFHLLFYLIMLLQFHLLVG